MSMTHQHVESGASRLRSMCAAIGPPIVLVHGNCAPVARSPSSSRVGSPSASASSPSIYLATASRLLLPCPRRPTPCTATPPSSLPRRASWGWKMRCSSDEPGRARLDRSKRPAGERGGAARLRHSTLVAPERHVSRVLRQPGHWGCVPCGLHGGGDTRRHPALLGPASPCRTRSWRTSVARTSGRGRRLQRALPPTSCATR